MITDIHGNEEALIAVLKMLDEYKCDEILHLGDVVDIGPDSRRCLEILLDRSDVTCLLGNHDRDFVLDHADIRQNSHVPFEHKRAVFDSMTEDMRRAVKEFPLHTERICGGRKLFFCHYALDPQADTWRQFPFMPLQIHPTAEDFDEIFSEVEADAVFFGHKHEPCDIEGRRLYVDVGSVGCHPEPYARAVLIEYDDAHWSYRRIQTPYCAQALRDKMHVYPGGDALFDYYFLRKNAE